MPGPQTYNDQNVDLLSAVFQRRKESNFALAKALSTGTLIPGVRGFWPMAAYDVDGGIVADVSGLGNTMTILGGVTFGVDALVPYAEFDGSSGYLSRPSETMLEITGGLCLGGWFYFNNGGLGTGSPNGLIGKWLTTGNQRGYDLWKNIDDMLTISISGDGSVYKDLSMLAAVTSGWHFCAGYYSPSSEMGVCMDGVWRTSAYLVPAAIYANNQALRIGNTDIGAYLDGKASLVWLAANKFHRAGIWNFYQQTKAMFGI